MRAYNLVLNFAAWLGICIQNPYSKYRTVLYLLRREERWVEGGGRMRRGHGRGDAGGARCGCGGVSQEPEDSGHDARAAGGLLEVQARNVRCGDQPGVFAG